MKKILCILSFIPMLLGFEYCNAQWQQTSCPTEYPIICLAISGSNIFAGTYGNGVYLSSNHGSSWTPLDTTGLANTKVLALAISRSNIFAGTDGGGVFLSSDNGSSWVNTGLTDNWVDALPISGSNIFAGTDNGVYLSSNNGSSWVNIGLTGYGVESLAISGSNIFAATDYHGVFLSSNNGENWVNIGLTNIEYIWPLAISGSNIFAGTYEDGLYLSSNNGNSWVNTGLTGNSIYALAISGEYIFAGTDDGVYLSSNNGSSWVNTGLEIVNTLAISGSNIFAGTYEGVWKMASSDNGQLAITTQPVSTTICSTGTTSFSVIATSDTTISYQWQVNNGNWSNIKTIGSNPAYSGYDSSTLSITNPQVSGLTYRCIVSSCSPVSYDTSDTATLTVQPGGNEIIACYTSMTVPNPTGGNWIWGQSVSIGDTLSAFLRGTVNDYDVPWCTSFGCCDNNSYNGMSISRHTIIPDTSYIIHLTGGLSGGSYWEYSFIVIPSCWSIDSITNNYNGWVTYYTIVNNKISFQSGLNYGGCVCSDCGRADLKIYLHLLNAGPNRIICQGDSVKLTATGNASYLWNTGDTTASITVKPKITTTYIVTITSACCTITDFVKVTVNSLPSQANAGSDQNVKGTSTTLAANTATEGTGLWSIISGSGGAIADSINPTSSFTGIKGNTYILLWTITNSCDSSSDTVVISFNGCTLPVINNIIPNQSVCQGKSVSFTVDATGDNLSYQWKEGGTAVAGETGSIYTISDVKASDYNFYSCKVSNTCGSVQLPAFNLTIAIPITINPAFHNQSQCVGDSIGFTLNPTAGSEPYSYQWLLNGNTISDATNSLYSKTSISIADSGKYLCIISNVCNSVTGDVVSLTPIICNRTHHTISGYVYYDNKAKTPLSSKFDSTVTNVYLYNAGDTLIDKVQTDDNGYYEFVNIINGTYYVTGSTKKAWGGSNPTDALIVNRDYIGMYNFTDSLLYHAGDVDSNGVLNPSDALLINRRYIGVIQKYPRVGDWKFQKIKVEMAGENLSQDIKAVCSGDVNASYAPYLIPGKVMSYELGVMSNEKINIDLNKPFDIPIFLNDNAEIGAIGLKFKVYLTPNPSPIGEGNSNFKVLGIKSDIDGLIYNITEDGVNVAWAAVDNGFNVNPFQPLFYITAISKCETFSKCFTLPLNSNFQITSESVLADIDANIISTDKLAIPEIVLRAPCTEGTQNFVSLQCYPNPFSNITNINYTLPEDANVEMDLYNVLGEKVATLVTTSTGSVTGFQKAGSYSIKYDGSNLKPGVYYCRIDATNSTSAYTKTNIMIIAR